VYTKNGDSRTTRSLADPETLRTFLDRSPVVAFIRDDTGRYIYINPAMEHHIGVLTAELEGHQGGTRVGAVPQSDGSVQYWKILRFPFSGPGGARFVGGFAVNVTDVQQTHSQLAESERRYRQLVENGQGLICTHDMEGRVLTVNQAALTLAGYTADQVIGRNLRDVLSPLSRQVFSLYLERMEYAGSDDGMMYVQAASGRELAWKYHNVRIDEPGKPSYVLGHAQDVTELREAEQRLRQLANTDDLTGLLNRRGFLANGSRLLSDAVAQGKGAAVFYVDIDGLKAINDDHGHDAGSTLIIAAAEAMKNSFRAADVLARTGGDEFVALVIVPPDDVATISKRLKWHVDKFNASSALPYSLSMSIGVSRLDREISTTLEGLVREADAAMYRLKRPAQILRP
jgi:diguanylate cyclase (GGDEF)-like protein/PAS domain S-box-containing protein